MAEKEALNKADAATYAPLDGAKAVAERRRRTKMILASLSGVYVFGGWGVYYLTEGFTLPESLVFTLSVLTGIGYGHVAPVTSVGKVFSAAYILAGLVLFASLAGEVLDNIMESEMSVMLGAVKDFTEGRQEAARISYQDRIQNRKRRHFVVGCINVTVLSLASILGMKFVFSEDWVNSIYMSAIYVLKLDSLCAIDGVTCNHKAGSLPSVLGTIAWYVISYTIIGHFLVSASHFFGSDPEANVSRLNIVTEERVKRMDNDGDGRVSRSEFLRDRLLQDGLVDTEVLDAILRNFDRLSAGKDYISMADAKKMSA